MRLSRPLTPFRRPPAGYAVRAKLGGGRYGVCYLLQGKDGTRAVLKRFRKTGNPVRDHGGEAVFLSTLDHPAIPALLGVQTDSSYYGFLLEYLPGETLEQLLFRRRHVFSHWEIYDIGTQLLDVLLYLHRRGVVHRDVRISNLLYDGAQLSLLDFGLSQYAGANLTPDYDLPFVGEVFLYLLYSRYTGPKRGTWYEQLPLSPAQRRFLGRLLGLEAPFATEEELRAVFQTCFRPAEDDTAPAT